MKLTRTQESILGRVRDLNRQGLPGEAYLVVGRTKGHFDGWRRGRVDRKPKVAEAKAFQQLIETSAIVVIPSELGGGYACPGQLIQAGPLRAMIQNKVAAARERTSKKVLEAQQALQAAERYAAELEAFVAASGLVA